MGFGTQSQAPDATRIAVARYGLTLAIGLSALTTGCQKEDHPPFATGCTSDCKPMPSVSIGSGTTGTPTTMTDGGNGSGTLTGQVLQFTDQTFVAASLFAKTATVSADGATTATVTAAWDGADPYTLAGLALETTNWISVQPGDLQGDALLTYQAVDTTGASTANLAVVSGPTLDEIFTSVSAIRSPTFGQVVLFFRSAGNDTPLSGLHVAMAAAQIAAYASGSNWILDDGTAVTDTSGLVLFGNVDTTGSTATVTVSRVATATTAAADGGTFTVKAVEGAVTLASVDAQL